jgi:hypothetical protein
LEKFIRFTSPSSFGIKQENVLDETYCKAGVMVSQCFSPMLRFHNTLYTEIMCKIKDDLLDGTKSVRGTSYVTNYVLHKLNVYGMNLILIYQSLPFDTIAT